MKALNALAVPVLAAFAGSAGLHSVPTASSSPPVAAWAPWACEFWDGLSICGPLDPDDYCPCYIVTWSCPPSPSPTPPAPPPTTPPPPRHSAPPPSPPAKPRPSTRPRPRPHTSPPPVRPAPPPALIRVVTAPVHHVSRPRRHPSTPGTPAPRPYPPRRQPSASYKPGRPAMPLTVLLMVVLTPCVITVVTRLGRLLTGA